MTVDRRNFTAAAALLATGIVNGCAKTAQKETNMYGLIGKITAADGKRDELASILLNGTKDMPGCLSYVIAADPNDASVLWVTEVWKDRQSHQQSLSLPSVQDAIAKGREFITGMDRVSETEVLGGHGLTG